MGSFMSSLLSGSRAEKLALKVTADYRRMLRPLQLFDDVTEVLEQPISPQMAVGIAMTHNAWHEMEIEFGRL